MTTPTISQSFVTRFNAEVLHLYQQQGSVLRGRLMNRMITGNEKVRFPRLAALGAPGSKAANGDVPIMDITHDYVECSLADYFAALLVDDLDQAQTNISISMNYAKAIAASMGRQIDDVIITEMDATTTADVAAGAVGLTFDKIRGMKVSIDKAEIPKTGRKWVIAPEQESDLLGLLTTTGNHPISTSADFVQGSPLIAGQALKTWMGFEWILSTRLPVAAGVRTTFAWHEDAIGLAWGRDVTTSIDWIPLKHGHLIKSVMLLSSKIVQAAGVRPVLCVE